MISHAHSLILPHTVLLQNPNRVQLAEDKFREIAEAYEVSSPMHRQLSAPAGHTAHS